jgi:transcription elongation GreA/GreB family factor
MSTHPGAVLFLAPDLAHLEKSIANIVEQVQRVKADAAESVAQSSESWHDNYSFEEAQRQLKMLLNHLGGLSKARERALEVEASAHPTHADIGTLVEYTDATGAVFTAGIGSYMVSDTLFAAGFVSYQSPLGNLLYGAHVGERRHGNVGGRELDIIITAVLSGRALIDSATAS